MVSEPLLCGGEFVMDLHIEMCRSDWFCIFEVLDFMICPEARATKVVPKLIPRGRLSAIGIDSVP